MRPPHDTQTREAHRDANSAEGKTPARLHPTNDTHGKRHRNCYCVHSAHRTRPPDLSLYCKYTYTDFLRCGMIRKPGAGLLRRSMYVSAFPYATRFEWRRRPPILDIYSNSAHRAARTYIFLFEDEKSPRKWRTVFTTKTKRRRKAGTLVRQTSRDHDTNTNPGLLIRLYLSLSKHEAHPPKTRSIQHETPPIRKTNHDRDPAPPVAKTRKKNSESR